MGEIIGVTGIDLSLDLLSDYISRETVGKTGKIFVLSSEGDLIVPEMKPQYFSTISPEVVSAAFTDYRNRKIQRFQFEWKGVSYLCDIEPFPLKNGDDWLIAIVVPHDDFFAQLQSTQKSALLIVLLILGVTGLGVVVLSKRLSRPIVLLAKEVDKVRQLDFSNEIRMDTRVKEIYLMDLAIAQMRSAVQSFTRYVPKEIVQGLFAQNQEIRLGGEKKEVTVFFSDIEGFTTITEAQPTEALMALLAEYFDGMSKIILAAGGTIDKYIGDSIMAFWGAPKPCSEQAAVCAETVLRCHAFVQEFNRRCLEKKLPVFKTRFGVNSGVAIVGNIGTPERMNYTLIGDMVNAAARIQVKNKDYGTLILLGEATQKQLGERFVTRPVDCVEVKGKREKIALFELMEMR
jgi:adenylate cyclase